MTTDYFTKRRAQRIALKSLASLTGFKNSKSLEEDTPIGIDFSTHEYAIERKVLEAPGLELRYYVDVVGDVPIDAPSPGRAGGLHDIGNRDTDPEWGFDLVLFGGFIRYGPWADRQRYDSCVPLGVPLIRAIIESNYSTLFFLKSSMIMRSLNTSSPVIKEFGQHSKSLWNYEMKHLFTSLLESPPRSYKCFP